MIVYDSKKWDSFFKVLGDTFKQSYNLKALAKFMTFIIIYSSLVTWLSVTYLREFLNIDTIFFSLIGVIISLFMVFRLNSAYDRWWEGRLLWGKMIMDTRTICQNLNALLPEDDRRRRRFFVRNIYNFALAMQGHLRDDPGKFEEFIRINKRYIADIEAAEHVPNTILSYMYIEVEHMYQEGSITDLDKNRLFNQFEDMTDALGGCERIKNTPIPFSHSSFIKMFTMLYLAILPFGLVAYFGWLTIPAVIVMGFALIGVEVISEEIENPFGLEANSLPLTSIADTMRDNAYELLRVKSNFIKVPKESKKTEILI